LGNARRRTTGGCTDENATRLTFAKTSARNNLSIPGQEKIQTRVDLDPGVTAPKHKHPGEEIIYVIEGTIVTTVYSFMLPGSHGTKAAYS